MFPPSNWREALGGELSAAQRLAEFIKIRQDQPTTTLLNWFKASTLDRANGARETWNSLPQTTWQTLAEQLADEAAAERQRM